ncbi:MAG TPA: dicarboxylate/amino acid:cation symporter [Stellaceae bacterium]|nr:dicarboxylate/amino acid:cation symporter [Stellaceae bacterium]
MVTQTDVAVRPHRGPFYKNLTIQVLAAIIIGAFIGEVAPNTGVALQPLGTIFISLVKMVIAPIIFLTVVTGIAHMGDMKKVGRVGGKALIYFELVTTLALVLGMIVVNVVQPGHRFDASAVHAGAEVGKFAAAAKSQSAFDFVINIFPDNAIGAFVKGDILQVLVFALLFGAALTRLGERGKPILDSLDKLSKVFFGVIAIIMYVAPLGALGAMAFTIGKFGLGSLWALGELMLCVYLTMALFIGVGLALIAKLFGFNVYRFIWYIRDEILIVLGTSSSETVLPRIMEKLERFGAARPVVGLVIPTGYSFNLDGTSIYLSMAVLFIAQVYRVELGLGEQIWILLVLLMTSKGAAGVTGAGFITLAATLAATGTVPVEGLALLLGVDRFMSEARAITNLIGNAVATVVIAKTENAFDETAAVAEYRREFDNPAIQTI